VFVHPRVDIANHKLLVGSQLRAMQPFDPREQVEGGDYDSAAASPKECKELLLLRTVSDAEFVQLRISRR
jgi:hypothetical protein